MAGPIATREKRLKIMHGLPSVPAANYRDASNSIKPVWKQPPTLVEEPSSSNRPQPPPQPPLRKPNGNPFNMTNNTLSTGPRTSHAGNPTARKTLLMYSASSSPLVSESPAFNPPKLDSFTSLGPEYGINGSSSSRARGISRPSNASDPEIQVVNPTSSVWNHDEIITHEDVGERTSRHVSSSSADELLILPVRQDPKRPHDFDVHPQTRLPVLSKGKGRATSPEFVADSEEDIEEFEGPSSKGRLFGPKTPGVIPKHIVQERIDRFERFPEPAAMRVPIRKGVPAIHLLDQPKTLASERMKKKAKPPPRVQGGTSPIDPVGTSSSNFKNTPRAKEEHFTFPLEAWCFGYHEIPHSEDAPLTLKYDAKSKVMGVLSGKHREVKFKLDRDVDSVQTVIDVNEPLKSGVVVRFTSVSGGNWKKYQSKLEGFTAGGLRHKGDLTLLFSISKERGFNQTRYMEFATLIKRQFASEAVEIIRPSAGRACWEKAHRYADMYKVQNPDNSNNITEDDTLSWTRGATPSSSTSAKSQTSRPDSVRLNGDTAPPIRPRRSARQSTVQTVESSPPRLPPPLPSEPDELVLMYPPTGTGALSIMLTDLNRLRPEEYLNDTLIEFGLKLWLNDLRERDPALADQIHVFSSFFYKKLNNRKNPEEGYRSVRKWTSKVPLFSKKYVIVPINENIHWYLAIIYDPGHTLEPPLPPSQPQNARMTRKRKQEQEHAEAVIETPLPDQLMEVLPEEPAHSGAEAAADPSSITATCASTPYLVEDTEMANIPIAAFEESCSISVSMPVSVASSKDQFRDSSPQLLLPFSDPMDIDADNSSTELQEKAAEQGPSSSKSSLSTIPASRFYVSASNKEDIELADAPVVITEDSEDQQQEAEVDDMLAVPQLSPTSTPQTYIFTLDSLGTRHPQAIKVLKQYLAQEAKDKHNFDQVREAIGKQVQVPVQPNSWDCGIYLLHFVKVFMSSPAEFLEQILSTRGTIPSTDRKKRWQDHQIPLFRDNLRARISELSEKWKASREEEAKKQETEDLSSEGEVDIVDDRAPNGTVAGRKRRAPRPRESDMGIELVPSGKAARERQPAKRLRG